MKEVSVSPERLAALASYFVNVKMRETPKDYPPDLMHRATDSAKAIGARALQKFTGGDLQGCLAALGRNNEPGALQFMDEMGIVSDEQLRGVLLNAWSGVEWPLRALPRKAWLAWFQRTGYLGGALPTAPVEVWRAQVGRTLGLSWTTRRERGVWFHERNQRNGFQSRLVHGFAPPELILAELIDSEHRNEAELVIAPGKFWKEISP